MNAEGIEQYGVRKDFRYLHEPIADELSSAWVVGRTADAQGLADRIMLSRGGAFLVSGLRGVGKTTCVGLAIHLIREQRARFGRLCGELELVDVWINLARPLKPVQLLHHLIRHLYLRLKEMGLLAQLGAQLRQDLQTAFLRTSFEISSRSLVGEESSRGEEVGFGKAPWLGIEFLGKISSSYKRSRSDEEALKYLPYDEKAAEFELLSLSRRLLRGFDVKESRWRRWWKALWGIKRVNAGIKVVFVLDELDKLESHKSDSGKSHLDPVLQALKSVFTSSGFSFVFVAGKEVEERLVEDIARGNSIYESIFAYDLYLPCLWEEQADIVHRCMEDGQATSFDKQGALALYLRYKGRGVPRRTWRELNKHVVWENERPLLVVDQERRRHMEVFAKVQEALDADETFTNRNGVLDPVQSDRLRLGFYYTMDWVFSRDQEVFGLSHITSKIMGLNLGVSSDTNWPARVANSVIGVLVGRAFVERADRDLTQVGGASEEALYRISPWVLLALRGASGKLRTSEGPAAVAPDRERSELERIGRYTVLDKLGEGGFAVVYRVSDGHGKILAAKVLRKAVSSISSEAAALFQREVQALQALQHPGIVNIHESGVEQGQHYVIMDLIEGVSLRQVIDSVKSMEKDAACTLATRLAHIFAYVHGQGLVRLDIKPSNVILTGQGDLKVIDFGIAVAAGNGLIPQDTTVVGTRGYMAPEQMLQGQIDVRGDVFSLGVLLFELLTGRLPGDDKNLVFVVPRKWLSVIDWTGVPRDLRRILEKALAWNPAERFQTMGEFAEALASWATWPLHELVLELSQGVRQGAERREEMTMPPFDADLTVLTDLMRQGHLVRGQRGVVSSELEAPVAAVKNTLRGDTESGWDPVVAGIVEQGARDQGRYQLLFDLSRRVCVLAVGTDVFETSLPRDGPLIMGRDPQIQLVLDDASISRRQLAFFAINTMVEVEDLSSANGTFINGKRIRRAEVSDQDVIRTGSCEIRIHVLPVERTVLTQTGASDVRATSAGSHEGH